MIINHNMAAMNTHRQLGSNNAAAANNIEKLSSGLKINKAGDDAAGLAISEKMRGQIRGLDMAAKNSQDGISLIQTAEGSLNETHDILQRMRELAVQAGNDTNTENDRGEIQKELNSLTSEVNRIGNTTEFNTQKLLNGAKNSATKEIAAGGELSAEVKASVSVGDLTFTAKDVGASGNDLSVEIKQSTNPTGEASAAAFADGKLTITIGTASDGSALTPTADDLKGLVETNTGSGNDAFTVTVATGKGSTAQTVAPSQSLAGGKDKVLATEAQEAGASLNFQIGANENQSLTLDIADMRASALGLTTAGTDDKLGVNNGTNNAITEQALDVSTHKLAAEAVTKIQDAIDTVSGERSKLGSTQNRLEHTINNLGTSSENLTAAESRIRDVDMAKEMMDFTKNNILTQAAQAMLSQANQAPQGVLQLLR